MSRVPLLPAPRLITGVERSLFERTEQRLLAPARSRGHQLQLVGATVLPQGQTIAQTSRGSWIFVDHKQDPTALYPETKGKIPIPRKELELLRDLSQGGRAVRPDVVYFGHQLPAGWQANQPLPRLVPAPRHLRQQDERLTLVLRQATELFVKGAAGLLTLAVAPLALAGVGLDPIVFGGVKHPSEPVVSWCVLCAWEWE